jgi:hypothetical protein
MRVPQTYKATLAAAMCIAIETWIEDEATCRAAGHTGLADQFALQIEQARAMRDDAEG